MAQVYSSLETTVGHTPLLELSHLGSGLAARILVKLELCNPAGSAKDRVALAMIRDAEEKKLLRPDSVIIEPTSGNTGIALAMICAFRGYRCIIVMPDSMSRERIHLIEAYGAEVVLTPGAKGMTGAIEQAEALASRIPHSFIPDQFRNPANPAAHYRSTGPEIWQDTAGAVDILVAGVGTGGTITGTGQYLREKNPAVRIVAVEPADSPLLSGGEAGPHGIQGIGANFIPEILDRALIDEIVTATTEQSYAASRLLARREGVLAGISSGAALHAAMILAQRPENAGKTIVAILPDTGQRYLSSPLFRS